MKHYVLQVINKKTRLMLALLLFSLLALASWAYYQLPGQKTGASTATANPTAHNHQEAESHDTAQPPLARGPHGGDIQQQGDYQLESLWLEQDQQVQLRFWLYRGQQALSERDITASLRLERPIAEPQMLTLNYHDTYWQTSAGIAAPHAFKLQLEFKLAQQSLRFQLQRDEGIIKLNQQQINAAAIELAKVESAKLASNLQFPGEIKLNQDRTAHVVPRIAGVVESVHAELGQSVKKGQLLAVIASVAASEQRSELLIAEQRLALAKTTAEREKRLWQQQVSAEQDYLQAQQAQQEAQSAVSNARQKLAALGLSAGSRGAGLNRFELRAPFDGMVIEKHLSLGEAIKEDTAVFTISDLTQVWAEMNISAKDIAEVRVGETVSVISSASAAKIEGKISYVGALIGEQSRSAIARVVLANPQNAWRPGLFVNVALKPGDAAAVLTVLSDAVQQLDDQPVVFVRIAEGFLAQPVKLGRSDGKRLEVLSGLSEGQRYAANGSFILKSELGKASAEHSH